MTLKLNLDFLLHRILNLELMSEYGCESWRIHNSVLTQMIQQSQKIHQDLRFYIL